MDGTPETKTGRGCEVLSRCVVISEFLQPRCRNTYAALSKTARWSRVRISTGFSTKTPAKVMNLSVNDRHKERARTNPSTSETLVHLSYLEDPTMTMGDFVNTLSHECTHYEATGASWDRGHSSSLRDYVSYGIGCLDAESLCSRRILPVRSNATTLCGQEAPLIRSGLEHADD